MMIGFLIVFFLIYGGMHAYAFRKIENALSVAPAVRIGLVLFLLLMLLAPLLVRYAERYGFPILSRILAYAGYTWMGVLFLFVCLSLLFDFGRLLVSAADLLVHRDLARFFPSGGQIFAVSLVLALGITVYGWFEARNIRREALTIRSSRIPAIPGKIRIVQISDVHLGLMVGDTRFEKIMAIVREAAPDILVCTGDLIDGQGDDLVRAMASIRDLKPRYGKFAVTGNHEFYAGLDHALTLLANAGFIVLRGEGVTVPGLLAIAGVDDQVSQDFDAVYGVPEETLLAGLPPGYFTLFLKHRPLAGRSRGAFDLQLSGHTHNGQIFPFRYVTRLFFSRQSGFFRLSPRSSLYVSRGSGTWGPPIRVLSPPEVTVIDLLHAEKEEPANLAAIGPSP